MRVGNLGTLPLDVTLRHAVTGEVDSIMVQPGGKPRIPEGYEVHPVDAHKFGGILVLLSEPAVVVEPKEA